MGLIVVTLVMKPIWTLELTTEEIRVINRALRGNLRDVDLAMAANLSDSLTTLRANAAKELSKSLEKNLENIKDE